MPAITEGVEFDTVAREIRCKWSPENDKVSLQSLQAVLNAYADALKAVPGCTGVKRIVCGACQDFKIIVSVPAGSFGAWEVSVRAPVMVERLSLRTALKKLCAPYSLWQGKNFAPETEILAAMNAIEGVTDVETQTYTFMEV
jgi:hypothetical protein